MKYFNMLKVFEFVKDIKAAAEKYDFSKMPQPKIEPVRPEPDPIGDRYEKLKDEEEELLSLLRDVKEQLKVPETVDPKTILSEEEVDNILKMLVQLQENIFSETPISQELVKQFVWNIPREIYDLSMRNYNQKKPPCMNPMYWFYMFCIDFSDLNILEKEGAFANAVCTATSMPDDEFEMLVDTANTYRDILSDENLIPD